MEASKTLEVVAFSPFLQAVSFTLLCSGFVKKVFFIYSTGNHTWHDEVTMPFWQYKAATNPARLADWVRL